MPTYLGIPSGGLEGLWVSFVGDTLPRSGIGLTIDMAVQRFFVGVKAGEEAIPRVENRSVLACASDKAHKLAAAARAQVESSGRPAE